MPNKVSEVAILLATYNGEQFLKEQLDSIVNQSFQDFVCYIHDDGSTDKTISILQTYANKYPDKFKILNYPGGQGAAGNFLSLMNYAVNNCKEKYYFFSDQDDVWLKNKVELELKKLKQAEKNDKPTLIYCDQIIVDEKLKIISKSGMNYSKRSHENDNLKHLAFENNAPGCVIGINRSLLVLANNIYNKSNIVMHDWWIMLVAICWGEINYLDKPLMLYRQHGDNTLGAEKKDLKSKVNKYLNNLGQSLKNKNNHVKKCERQLIELGNIKEPTKFSATIQELSKICKKNKIKKIQYFFNNGYIREPFTLLFV